jgi:DHA1 family quinolone resistance protein-like MFS transporter
MPLDTVPGITRRFGLLSGLQEFAIWLPLPIVILHMTGRDVDLGLIGIAFAIRAIFVVLLEVPTGGLADAIGRKPIALCSQAFTLLSLVALLFLGGPITLLMYAVLQGIGAALHSGALEAWYVDTLKKADADVDLQKNFASISVVQSAAMLVAATIGGTLPSFTASWDLPWPLSAYGIALLAGIVMRGLVWLLTVVLVHEPAHDRQGTVAGLQAVPAIVTDALNLSRRIPVVPYLLFASTASGIAMIAIEMFWQPIALPLGASASQSGLFGIYGATMGAGLLLGGVAVMRFGSSIPGGSATLAGVSQLLKGAALILLATQSHAIGLAGGLMLAYFFISVNGAPHDAILNNAIPSERRSVMMSISSLAFFLGIALGSAFLGQFATIADPRLALVLGGALTAVASLAYVGVAFAQRKETLRKTTSF